MVRNQESDELVTAFADSRLLIPDSISPLTDRGGSRTHRHQALDLIALPVCVLGRETPTELGSVSMAGSGVAPDEPGL